MLTKKHFRVIATILRESTTVSEVVDRMVFFLKVENPRFKEGVFREWIGDKDDSEGGSN